MAFILNFFKGILYKIGILNKNANIVFLGLDNAGKITLLEMLKEDKFTHTLPTQQPHSEELIMGGLRLRTFDLGGHQIARKLWKDYYSLAHAIIYLVDTSAKERLEQSRIEFEEILSSTANQNVPVAILGNKIDKTGSIGEEELRTAMNLPMHMTYGKKKKNTKERPIEVFMCSVAKRMGYIDAFQWINQFLK